MIHEGKPERTVWLPLQTSSFRPPGEMRKYAYSRSPLIRRRNCGAADQEILKLVEFLGGLYFCVNHYENQ